MGITKLELKNIKKLKDKKYRRKENLFLVEGEKACRELLNSSIKIKLTLSSNPNFNYFDKFRLVDFATLKSIATIESPQDIICVAEIPDEVGDFPKGNSLILDNIQDPGNIGTLIRSACAFDFLDLYLINCPDIYNEKVIRSSMGAIFKIRPHIVTREFIKEHKHDICDILVGTDLKSKSGEIKGGMRVSVILGNEGNGVSAELLDLADKVITLKMTKNVESLNVGVAGSIIMFEIFNAKM